MSTMEGCDHLLLHLGCPEITDWHPDCGELNLQPQQHSTGAIKLCIEVI